MSGSPLSWRLWLIISSWASLAGWCLGLTEHLDEKGYFWAFVSLGVFLIFFACFNHPFRFFSLTSSFRMPFLLWRRAPVRPQSFLFWLPLLFSLVALLAFLGGILYKPSNYDALSYRIPRLLHWMDAGQWCWINTPNLRQNIFATGYEWLMMPFLVFFKSDRFFFLVNWISFLWLPGLIYRTFRLAGISAKTCWWWMWLLPLAYGYVLQSGSIGNDAFATVYALASVCFVLSADKREKFSDFNWSILSVALLTGTKGSNMPLALPWLVAMLLRYKIWRPHFLKLLPYVVLGLVVSFLPMAASNYKHTGTWTGDAMDQSKVALTNPPAGVFGNSLMLGYSTLQPPLLLASSRVNDIATRLLPSRLKAWLLERFPNFELKIRDIPLEESAGLGLGLTTSIFLWIYLSKWAPCSFTRLRSQSWFNLGLAGLCSMLFYMAKMGSESTARLLLPYYPFLFLLALGFCRLSTPPISKIRWVFFFFASWVIVPLILSPARPLFPVQKLLTLMGDSSRLSQALKVYQTYMQRANCWDPALAVLPPSIKTLGFFSHGDDLEAPLWRPFGLRNIVSTSEKDITISGLPHAEAWFARRPIAEFLKSNPEWQLNWKEAGTTSISQKASVGSEQWALFLPR
jgi:hypothetical protein